MKRKDYAEAVVTMALIAGILLLTGWWASWRWDVCRSEHPDVHWAYCLGK